MKILHLFLKEMLTEIQGYKFRERNAKIFNIQWNVCKIKSKLTDLKKKIFFGVRK